jgi:hypothetical protein
MTTPKPANSAAERPLTQINAEFASVRASVNKLARAQNALLFNVKALSDEVRSLSGAVKAIRLGAAEDEARRQLH